MELNNVAKQIFEQIENNQTIIIQTHRKPDFDAIGSQIGLKLALKKHFPDKQIYAVGEKNASAKSDEHLDTINDALFKNALVIITDTATTHLISDERYQLAPLVIKIDHHLSGKDFAHINYVDTDTISASQIIGRLLFNEGYEIDKDIARLLMMGIVTDSGSFRYKGVSSETFSIAAKLMDFNVDMQPIYTEMYKETVEKRKYRGYICSNFETTKNGVAYIKNTLNHIKNVSPDNLDISRNLVNALSDIEGCPIWISFTELDKQQGIKAAIRSSHIAINEIAALYGGGGHALASGATLKNWVEVDQLLAVCDKAIEQANSL